MKKADTIRDAMQSAPWSTQAHLVELTKLKLPEVATFLSGATARDEVHRKGDKGSYTYALNSAYEPSRKGSSRRAKRLQRSKRPKGFAGAARERQKLREIAAKAKQPAPGAELVALTVESVLSSAQHLVATVRETVEGIDGNPTLDHALKSYELAERVHRAAAARA